MPVTIFALLDTCQWRHIVNTYEDCHTTNGNDLYRNVK